MVGELRIEVPNLLQIRTEDGINELADVVSLHLGSIDIIISKVVVTDI